MMNTNPSLIWKQVSATDWIRVEKLKTALIVFFSHVGHIFLDVHEAQPHCGARLVFVLKRHKITVFICNSGRSVEFVDFLTSFRLMSITSRIS